MLFQIASLLLGVIGGLLTGACLLRFYMQLQRVPFSRPLGPLIFALTDWLVKPLRRVLPSIRGWDTSSITAAYIIQLISFGLLWLLSGAELGVLWVLVLAVFGLLREVLTGLCVLLLVYAVLSWVQPHSVWMGLLQRLCDPLLRPFRRIIPLLGGVDLSPLALLLLLQVLLLVLGNLQSTVMIRGATVLAGV